jgi:TldD protein
VKDRLIEALKSSTADYAEIRFETEDSTTIAYRGPEVEKVDSGKFSGGIARACTKGGWGAATFDSPDDMGRALGEACQCAALVGREKTQLAEADAPADAAVTAKMDRDFRGVPLDEKLKLISKYNQIVLTVDPAVETSRVAYGDSFRTVHFASTRGACYMEQRPKVTIVYFATARDGPLVQNAWNSASSTAGYAVAEGREADVEAVARRAAELLKAPPCRGGATTVVLDPELAGVFAHEAFGHLSEGDFLYENAKMRELMHLGREMGVKELNIVDDGSFPRLIGTHPYDDEGTPTQKTYLIREGVLTGHLHSLETAAKMNARPTGNARAINRHHQPIVRMTNTYIEPGGRSFDELLAGIDDGVYACGSFGGQTMMEMFTFSAAYGHRIRGGQVGELVRDVVLTGNVFETLNNMDAFGSDLRMCEKGGGCGKDGQAPLPVGFGSPHLRIRNVIVGGR